MDHALTPLQKTEIRKAIRRLMEELQKQTGSLRSAASAQSSQERTGDEGDIASRNAEEAVTAKLISRNSKQARALNMALQRMSQEDFGYCDSCGDEIGYKRLLLKPTAENCLPCAKEAEAVKKRKELLQNKGGSFFDFASEEEVEPAPPKKS